MNTEPLDELYFTWLYSKVASTRYKNPTRTYWSLFRKLFTKEFVWLIPNDDNRVEDGRDLRLEFLSEEGIEDVDPAWLDLGCSMFELLLGLSRRLSFEAEGEPRAWFWLLLENLQLETYNDDLIMHLEKDFIDDVLDRVIWRQYDPDGHGGLFPLSHPKKDQRKVELWYQLSAYIQENE